MTERSLNDIKENLNRIHENIAQTALKYDKNISEIEIMAVTKTVDPKYVNFAIEQGISLLGENRVQEMNEKYDFYNKENIDIHFIGNLQTNKVKYIIGKVSMIESVNTVKLANEISRLSMGKNLITRILLEVNIGNENSKSGILPNDLERIIGEISILQGIKICGLMAIPPISTQNLQIDRYFYNMQALTVDINSKNIDNVSMEFLSMGMSDDYIHAIKYGANILRLGSAIFGTRK